MDSNHQLEAILAVVAQTTAAIQPYHPKALVLFGSLARTLAGDPGDRRPNDVDLLLVTNNPVMEPPPSSSDCPVELHRFTVERMVGIARSLRYDSRPVALSKLYGRVLAQQHAIDVIAAAMLLGPTYGDFGIEQIDIDGITDTRDYSIHRVLIGDAWWQRLRRYAGRRRGPWLRFSDKLVRHDIFDG
jgi:hypothetical protein